MELNGRPVKAPYEPAVMRGCPGVSVETCGAEGRQQSLGKRYNRGLGHFRVKTMGPIVIPPLTFGTFSTNPLHPQINHVGMSASRHWPESRGLFKSVYSLCWVHFLQIYAGYLLEAITQGGKHMDSLL